MAPSARTPAAKPARIVPVVPLPFTRPAKNKPVAVEETKQASNQTTTPAAQPESASVARASPKDSPQAPPTPKLKTPEADEQREVKPAKPAEEPAEDKANHVNGKEGGLEDSGGHAVATDQPSRIWEASGETPAAVVEPPAPSVKAKPHRPPFELPPPFYPSADRSTPTSTTSSTFARLPPPPNPVNLHHPHPSMNGGIVFGGYPDSSSVSPAPPLNGHMPYPAPPPGFAATNFMPPPPAMPFAGHAHQFSAPNGHVAHPSMEMPPPGGFGFRGDQLPPPQFRPAQPWLPPNGPMSNRPEHFSPHQNPVLNGNGVMSRTGSQVSSPRVMAVDQPPIDGAVKPHPLSMQNGVAPGNAPMPFGYPGAMRDTDIGLRDYLTAQFGNAEFADYVLKVFKSYGKECHMEMAIPGHGLILARSPKLAKLILSGSSARVEDGMRVLDVLVTDRFFDGYMFAEALKHLYGQDLVNSRNITEGLQPFTGVPANADAFGSPQQRMRDALAYAAAGYFLQVPRVTGRGLDIATDLLRWDNLEVALDFAMDGGIDASWRPDEPSGDENSSSSTDSGAFSSPSFGQYSTQFLQAIIGFIIHNFPQDFEFDMAAPQLMTMPRLPILPSERPGSRNPRLSSIRFGEVPVEAGGPSQYVHALLSSLLISLPFHVLKALLEDYGLCNRLGRDGLAQLTHAVIKGREAQKERVLDHLVVDTAGLDREMEMHLKSNYAHVEQVEPFNQHASGFRLVRLSRAINTPSSSASADTR